MYANLKRLQRLEEKIINDIVYYATKLTSQVQLNQRFNLKKLVSTKIISKVRRGYFVKVFEKKMSSIIQVNCLL